MTTMAKPQKQPKEIVYRNKYSHIYSQKVDFGSFMKEYFVNEFRERVGILVIRDGSVLLVRQYRLLIDDLSWEIPGGEVAENETPRESIIRECFEETGIRCRQVKPLLTYNQSLECVQTFTHLFYTKDFDDNHTFTPALNEVQSIQWVPWEQCFKMIKEGKMNDSFTVLALLAYRVFEIGKKQEMVDGKNVKLARGV